MRQLVWLRLWFVLAAIFGLTSPSNADELKPGYLEVTQQNAWLWRVTLKAPVRGGLAAQASPAMPGFCKAGPPARRLDEGSLYSDWRYDCAQSLVGTKVGMAGLNKTVTDALVRIAPLDRPVQVARLTGVAPMVEVVARASARQVATTYFALGIEHILSGYDHLLFVLSLVLLLSGGWVIARTVTAFTIAHSITLVGATLGFMGVSQRPVEICIALSIVFLAVEAAKRDPANSRLSERAPWAVAFLFGLLHGFGFASALAEIGMPEGEVPLALVMFNLGVEAGQFAVVFAALSGLALIARYSAALLRRVKLTSAYVIGTVASFWMIARVFA